MEKLNQYKDGTTLLWMANYRSHPDKGDVVGPYLKIDGTTVEAAIIAQQFAETNNLILQCLKRRY